ncbi:hypothetical protein KIN20_008589 [Parelaphostrongylus tenuis]|uniref:Protein LLP homolog n=1 Tax=Parelaphostrongylus tenuis TaxID=148309 RepID=A0AAD5QHJ9_PARTN|nr:hypothetical protein KIN20_008589 [Parelaphostrongylus tenuis]
MITDSLNQEFCPSRNMRALESRQMAKSLRSKFKRKIRALAREKKAHKERAWLEAAVSRRAHFERKQAAKGAETTDVKSDSNEVEMLDDASPNPVKKATINVKTMKRADGTYPPWLSGTQRNKLSKINKAAKKKKKLRAKKR